MKRVLVSFTAATAVAVALAGEAPAAPRWLAPFHVEYSEGEDTRAFSPDVAVNGRGDAVIGWNSHHHGLFMLEAISRPSGTRGWPSVSDVQPSVVLPVNLGLDATGNTTALYTLGTWWRASYRATADAVWREPITLSPRPYALSDGTLVVNPDGVALAAWTASAYPGPDAAEVSIRRTPSGPWERAVTLSQTPGIQPPGAALDSAGNGVVLWAQRAGTHEELHASFRSAAGESEQPVQLGGTFPVAQYIRVAFDGAGNATAVWDGGVNRLETAYRPFGGTWTEPEPVVVGALPIRGLRLVVTVSGDALALWDDGRSIRSAFRRGASHLWQVSDITNARNPPSSNCCSIDLAADARGDAVAIWPDGPDHQTVWAALRPAASGRWQPPVAIGRGDGQVGYLNIGTDRSGNAVAAWERDIDDPAVIGDLKTFVEVAELRAQGPLIESVTVPRRVRPGAAARFSVRAVPWGSPLQRAPRWQFGDGATATGSKVRHVYRRPGTYAVVVTARDEHGSTSATRTLVVTRRSLIGL